MKLTHTTQTSKSDELKKLRFSPTRPPGALKNKKSVGSGGVDRDPTVSGLGIKFDKSCHTRRSYVSLIILDKVDSNKRQPSSTVPPRITPLVSLACALSSTCHECRDTTVFVRQTCRAGIEQKFGRRMQQRTRTLPMNLSLASAFSVPPTPTPSRTWWKHNVHGAVSALYSGVYTTAVLCLRQEQIIGGKT